MKNHYENLSVSHDAPPEVIRAAYRALSQKWHPDKNSDPAAKEKMQAINLAYEILSNSEKRRKYDNEFSFSERTQHSHAARDSNEHPDTSTAREETTDPPKAARKGFDIDWHTVSEKQREQNRKYRLFGRNSLIAAFKTIALITLFFTIFGRIKF